MVSGHIEKCKGALQQRGIDVPIFFQIALRGMCALFRGGWANESCNQWFWAYRASCTPGHGGAEAVGERVRRGGSCRPFHRCALLCLSAKV